MADLRALLARAEDSEEDMLVIGQAQGILMHVRGLNPGEALLELFAQATRDQSQLSGAARAVIKYAPNITGRR